MTKVENGLRRFEVRINVADFNITHRLDAPRLDSISDEDRLLVQNVVTRMLAEVPSAMNHPSATAGTESDSKQLEGDYLFEFELPFIYQKHTGEIVHFGREPYQVPKDKYMGDYALCYLVIGMGPTPHHLISIRALGIFSPVDSFSEKAKRILLAILGAWNDNRPSMSFPPFI